MNKFNSIFILYILFILFSCNEDYPILINKHRDFQLYGLESSNFVSIRNFFYNDSNAIGYLIKDSVVKLILYDELGTFKNQINIDFRVFHDAYYANLFSFLDYIYNDSIIFISGEKQICIYNFKENRYKTIDLTCNVENSYNLLSLKSSYLTKINDSIVLALIIRKINQSTKEGRTSFFKHPPLVLINLKKEKVKNTNNINIFYPYFVTKDSNYYIDQQLLYAIYKEDIFYSMQRSPLVYKKNICTDAFDSCSIPSSYIKLEEIIPFNEMWFYTKDYYNKVKEYSYTVPKYSFLFFNKNLSVLLRVNSISTPYEINGKRTNYRNWSVSVIDTNLNLIGEIPFLKDSLYNFYNFIPSSKGFIVAYKQTEEDKRLKRTRLCEFEISY